MEVTILRVWKGSMLIIGLAVLLLSSLTVSAVTESDGQGDVWHFVAPYWQEQTVSNQPNVDIKEIKAEESGDQVTLSMTLWPGGTFVPSGSTYVACIMFYNISDAWYQMSYSYSPGQEPFSIGMGKSTEGMPSIGDVTVSDNGDTISTTLDKVGDDTTAVELYGTITMFEELGIQTESWFDWVGDYLWNPEFEPRAGDVTCWQCNENNESISQTFPAGTVCGEGVAEEYPFNTEPTCGTISNGVGGGTPGFETLTLLVALTIAFVLFWKRKK